MNKNKIVCFSFNKKEARRLYFIVNSFILFGPGRFNWYKKEVSFARFLKRIIEQGIETKQ